ncbi:TrkA C-terminal domain-containing protein [Arcanobacterium hippocoleae]
MIDEFVVSNHLVAGAKVEELQLHKNFQARIVRVFRGDDAILAYKDTHIAYGDRVEVIIDADRREDVSAFFGDSIKQYAALNWISVAGGLSIGYLAALIEIPLPGGGSFALGTALGPLFAGLILGTLKRTGGVAWQVPASANTSLQQLGLMIFLAAAGLNAGRAFAATAFSLNGLLAMILGIAVVIAVIAGFILCARLFGKAVERASGGGCGMLGQPAVLQYALANSSDPRVMEGYTSVFAIALILKIFIIPFMLL